jgi:hypothetical protein
VGTSESTILFLDHGTFEATPGVVQRIVPAAKHPANPVLPLGDLHEWDSLRAAPWGARSVIYDDEEGIFKAWYLGTDLEPRRWRATGYATSDDGLHWEKPRLGLHDYRGSTANNICYPECGAVIKDTGATDPARRYVMLAKPMGSSRGLHLAYSADGIHWLDGPDVVVPPWQGRAGDVLQGRSPDVVAFWRDDQEPDPQRRYKFVWQVRVPSNKPGPETVRAKCLAYGPDPEHLTASPANPILTPTDGLEQENHFLAVSPYAGYWLMLYEYGWYAPNGTGVFGSYSADVRLAVSRDGERFTRVQPHQPVIPRGGPGEWDGGFLVISDKIAVKADTIFLYYCGHGEEWTSWPPGNAPAGYEGPSPGFIRTDRMGLATLPRDRFLCVENADRETPGHVTVGQIEVTPSGRELTANVSDTRQGRSWIEAEVLDPATQQPLPGFGREDCLDVCRDGLRVPIRWRDHRLSDLPSRHLRIRCWLHGAARVYALQVGE